MINYPYRFKTREEMINNFGIDWKYVAFEGVGWNDEMDHLLGKDYPFPIHEILSIKDSFGNMLPRGDESFRCDNNDTWLICMDMLTKNEPIVPNYKPKEKIDHYEKRISI